MRDQPRSHVVNPSSRPPFCTSETWDTWYTDSPASFMLRRRHGVGGHLWLPGRHSNPYTTSINFARLKLWVKPGDDHSRAHRQLHRHAHRGGAPLSVTFTDSSTGSPAFWAWDFGDGNSSTVQSPSHSYAGTAPTP